MTSLTLGTSEIRQLDGLYSLNDLHQAAGGEEKHKPANFLRNEQAQALIAEISSCSDLSIIPTKTVTGKGKQQGTYVCRELVYAYANWISPAFYLKMIRAFDALQSAAVPPAPTLPPPAPGYTPEQFARMDRRAWELAGRAYETYRQQMRTCHHLERGSIEIECWLPPQLTADTIDRVGFLAKMCTDYAARFNEGARVLAEMAGVGSTL